MGLGTYPEISLDVAREKARACREMRAHNLDPIDERDAEERRQQTEKAREVTFRACGELYIAGKENAWKNAKHRQQWSNTLETYAYPIIGDLPVHAIDTPLVLKVLEQQVDGAALWKARPETASRLRGRIEVVLDWAKVRGSRAGENPARWRGHLSMSLATRSEVRAVKHHNALPFADVNAFITELRQRKATAALALEFLILTAARTAEALNTKWNELNLREGTWTIPAERMKAGKEHRVPLSPRAVAILADLLAARRDDDAFVFPGPAKKGTKPLSNMALLVLLRRMERENITVHGFRSTFRDWVAEKTHFPSDLAEMALAHSFGDAVRAAYQRGDLFEKRRELMNAWATYCERPATQDNVLDFPAQSAR
jgi:integrase